MSLSLGAPIPVLREGYIYWHAYPFNGELELHDTFVLDAALNLTFSLDDRFGVPHKQVGSENDSVLSCPYLRELALQPPGRPRSSPSVTCPARLAPRSPALRRTASVQLPWA